MHGAGQGLAGDERLVPLDVENHIEPGELRPTRHLRNPVGAGLVRASRKHRSDLVAPHRLSHPGGIGGDHQLLDEVVIEYAFHDPGDEGLTSQKLKRFVGEAG
jgi:hypothetical protein